MTEYKIINTCKPYTMISTERLMANIFSVQHVDTHKIEGDIVEIGVWKGGSMLSMMLAHEDKNLNREFYLYDTFEGMTEPTMDDVDYKNDTAKTILQENSFFKCISALDEVKSTIQSHSPISSEKIHYQVGDICKNTVYPEKIAVLRLDTDWYESTKFELDTFYNLVQSGGIVIIDDYGHWKGCRKAVDEFLENNKTIQLIPIDYTGVYFIKP